MSSTPYKNILFVVKRFRKVNMSHLDRDTVMGDALEQPKKGKNDMGEFEQHSLPDMIAMDDHLSAGDVGKPNKGKTKFLGMLVRQFSPPGTV